jgi:5-methylcytosine-specific restriction enzyme A
VAADASSAELPDLDPGDIVGDEGGVALRSHLRRERDPKLRRSKLADAKKCGLPIACEVCGFDYGQTYGAQGLDYIECHYRVPLHVTGETRARLADLALLCCAAAGLDGGHGPPRRDGDQSRPELSLPR